jgi:hypothetical protein
LSCSSEVTRITPPWPVARGAASYAAVRFNL